VERANSAVLYQLLDLEKEIYKNRIFTFSVYFRNSVLFKILKNIALC